MCKFTQIEVYNVKSTENTYAAVTTRLFSEKRYWTYGLGPQRNMNLKYTEWYSKIKGDLNIPK